MIMGTTNVGFKGQFCRVTYKLRDNIDAAEYSNVVLEPIFFKTHYITELYKKFKCNMDKA